jgi:hypothetical protein
MQPRVLQRLALTAVLVLGAGVSAVSTVAARPVLPVRPQPRVSGGFNLFAGSRIVRLNANRVDCNAVHNIGNICYDPSGSGTVEGGFWPNGTPNNYVFNGGLQVGGTVSYGAGTGPWAGDTVGAYFMDARGDQKMGDPVTNVFSSLNAADVAAWPGAAFITDTSLYNKALLGRLSISQLDSWVRYWDGNALLAGAARKHSMGVLVEQRGLLWNFPAGNQDILYFLIRFINITSTNRSDYDNLMDPGNGGYSTGQVDSIVAIAQDWHNRVQASYGVTIPAGGYTFKNMFADFFQDADEGNASFNYSEAILPFSLVAVMKSNYNEPAFSYPPGAHGEPFFPAPGFEAVKYLKSPRDATGKEFGISVWGNTCNGCGLLNDPIGTPQLYRYISGHISPALGDGACNSDPILLHTCASLQAYADTRFFESSGPFDLAPGQSSVIVVAHIFAAPLHRWAATTNGLYAMPAGQIETYDNGGSQYTYLPGWPASPDTLARVGTGSGARICTTLCDKNATIRDPVERPMGWGQFSDVNGDGTLQQNEVQTYPGSLLDKAKVAQAIFDNKFLLPFAPEAPEFYLVPGDNQVTVVWKKSSTETVQAGGGDPYYGLASDPTSALYDPDYRQYDVEGYRIWRGRTTAELQVIAQFDYAGTSITDFTGQVFDAGNPECAPELGLSLRCSVAFQYPYTGTGPSVSYDLSGNVVQILTGGRVQLQNGSVLVLTADTAVTGGATGFPALTSGGVPFAYVDNTVLNGFQYFYAVSAFDINSLKSGPSSLASAIVTKPTTPRNSSNQETAGSLGATQYLGADGKSITAPAMPTLDKTTGIFSGPMPPTDGIGVGFIAFVAQILSAPDSLSVRIDSVVPADGWNGVPGTYYVTQHSPAAGTVHTSLPFLVDFTNAFDSIGGPFPAAFAAQGRSTRFGGDSSYALYGQTFLRSPGGWDLVDWGRGSANSYPSTGNTGYNGPVWFDGNLANDTAVNPHRDKLHPAAGGGPFTNSNGLTAGKLTGAQVMHIAAYETVQSSPMRQLHAMLAYVARAADMKVYWGAAGKVDSVIDLTHHVPVPFSPVIRASWGILTDSSFTNTAAASTVDKNNGLLTWADIDCVAPAPVAWNGCAGTPAAFLMNHARLSPVAFLGSTTANAATLTQTGTGFIFYIAGQFFVMQMAALPAAGTTWTVRTYAGSITGSPGSFSFHAANRPAAVPGLTLQVKYQPAVATGTTDADAFASIHTVPDPYYVTNSLEQSPNNKVLEFVNVPTQCIIRIYSLSGVLIRVLTHNDPSNGGTAVWDLRNRNNQYVASGVYFYHVEAADGRTKIGRFTVVNFAQ